MSGARLGLPFFGLCCLALTDCSRTGDLNEAAARDPKVFAASPVEPPPPAVPGGALRSELEATLGGALSALAAGEMGEAQRASVQRSLLAILERSAWGSAIQREAAAQIVVQQLFDQARIQGTHRSESPARRLAMVALTKELTRQLLLMSAGKPAGADGIDAPAPNGFRRITWEQLGGFAYREGAPLPPDVRELSGQRVALPGFMLSLGETGDLTSFILVESLWGCCFGNVPQMNQMVLAQLSGAASYTGIPIIVAGTLDVGEEREGEYVTSLYRLRSATVHPLP